MRRQLIFTPTEARQNFFTLLKLAAQGKEIHIKNKTVLFRFELKEVNKQREKKRKKAFDDMMQLDIASLSMTKLKQVLDSRLDL